MSGGQINRVNYERFLKAYDLAKVAKSEASVAKSEVVITVAETSRTKEIANKTSSKLELDKVELQTSITDARTQLDVKFTSSISSEKSDKDLRISSLVSSVTELQTKNLELQTSLNNIVGFLHAFRDEIIMVRDDKPVFTSSEILTYQISN